MEIIRKFLPHDGTMPLQGGDGFKDDKSRRVQIRCSSASVDRMGDIIEQRGISIAAFRRNPVICWMHRHDSPIARAIDIDVAANGCLEAVVEFPQPGVSRLADTVYGLVRSDVIRSVSIGFQLISSEPLDKGNPVKGPQRIKKCDLLEVSFVSVPANPDACVLWKYAQGDERARRMHEVSELKKAGLALQAEQDRAKRLRQVEVARLAVPR